ncbi:uncharacterized protein B0H18DRAFT_959040 [Fomitopsis serialis]|uniref:uncharacterized protein n=1 Tax=Fomitopsis serialis TaxID=139415 RepID=UPI0020077CDD|nr:uncharacterized protein B0H18DRAFT_959040 [Neoantrodia serialis]KAH9915983.1 hypothetical protein B0H18DRAFT_959040 [Neoantrodia serialis]
MSSFAAEPSSAAFVATPPPRSPQRKSPPRPRSTSTSTTASPSPSPCPSSTARRPQPPSRRRIHVPRLDLLPHKAHAPFPALRALVRQLQHPRHQHAPAPARQAPLQVAHRIRLDRGTVRSHRAPAALSASQLARHREGAIGSSAPTSVSSLNGSSATPSPASLPDWQEILGPSNYMSIRAAAAEELFIQCRCLRAPQINRGFADRRLWYLSKVILPNHLSPMNLKALRDLGLNAAKRKEITLQFQVSSIGSYSTQWMNRFHCLARDPDPGLTPVGPRNAARDRVQLTRGPTSGAPNLQKEEDSPKPPEHWEVFSVFGDESPTLKGAMLSDQLPDATKPPPGCEKQ